MTGWAVASVSMIALVAFAAGWMLGARSGMRAKEDAIKALEKATKDLTAASRNLWPAAFAEQRAKEKFNKAADAFEAANKLHEESEAYMAAARSAEQRTSDMLRRAEALLASKEGA